MPDSQRGRLLVAGPSLHDPNFDRAVVFVLEHNDHGAIGVVVNRPSELPVRGTVERWDSYAAEPSMVFVGGPVSSSSVIALADYDLSIAELEHEPIVESVATVDIDTDPDDVRGVERVRLFAGYAGWAPGQLDTEVSDHDWFSVDARPDDLFTATPEELWWDVLARQGGALGRLRHFPRDLADN